ncbi:MAG: AraC family transcriptional regulator [Clostridia bacterium]|nr:AraC family transcriptional regulator [Clostridia bacterium]
MKCPKFFSSGYNVHEPAGLHFGGRFPLFLFLYFQSPVILNGKNEKEGCCILYPRDVHHDYRTLDGFSNSFLGFDAPDELISKLDITLGEALYPNNCSKINDLIYRICREDVLRDFGYEEKLSSLILDLLVALLRGTNDSNPSEYDAGQRNKFFAIRSEYLSDIASPPDINYLISISGFSRTQFYKTYSSIFHATPKEDLIWARLEKAKGLIASDAHMKMYEVASSCGFNNVSHFFRLFKRRYGYTPKEYSLLRQSTALGN